MSSGSVDTDPPGVVTSRGSSCVEPGSRWRAAITSCSPGTLPSGLSYKGECPGRTGESRASAGGATVESGGHRVPGLGLRLGGCGAGSARTVTGSTQGRRRSVGCGRGRLRDRAGVLGDARVECWASDRGVTLPRVEDDYPPLAILSFGRISFVASYLFFSFLLCGVP